MENLFGLFSSSKAFKDIESSCFSPADNTKLLEQLQKNLDRAFWRENFSLSECKNILKEAANRCVHGKKAAVWRCRGRMEKKGCSLPTVHERELHEAVVKAVRQANGPDSEIIAEVEKNTFEALGIDYGDVEKELQELQTELVGRVRTGQGYGDLPGRIRALKGEKERISGIRMAEKEKLERARQLKEFLESVKDSGPEYKDTIVRNFIRKIAVFPDDIKVTFRTGTEAVVEI